jgi:2-hydroxy-3-oxopropionate reductase
MKRIGFIGLGVMGKPMALNLIRAGYPLVVHDQRPGPARELVESGAAAADRPAEVAQRCELVITMLPNSADVKCVALGGGILEGARNGLIFIDMSSIAPLVAQEIAACCAAKGVRMLDAPVSGGEPKARDGTLSIMVGGDEDLLASVRDVFGAMGKSVVWTGPVGSGNLTKLANQIIVGLNIIAVSEALVLVTKAGIDPTVVYNAIRGGLAGSTVLDAKAPLMMDRNFSPGFRIELHLKDLLNALETAHQTGVPLLFTSLAAEVMSTLKTSGKGALDHGGLVQYFESLAGVELKKADELKFSAA